MKKEILQNEGHFLNRTVSIWFKSENNLPFYSRYICLQLSNVLITDNLFWSPIIHKTIETYYSNAAETLQKSSQTSKKDWKILPFSHVCSGETKKPKEWLIPWGLHYKTCNMYVVNWVLSPFFTNDRILIFRVYCH